MKRHRHCKWKMQREHGNNFHHIFFQKKHFDSGYAKALRDHPYTGFYIPQHLHANLHSQIHDVPKPNGNICKHMVKKLNLAASSGIIDVRKDTIEQRLQFLIKNLANSCLPTLAILEWQLEFFQEFTSDYEDDDNYDDYDD